MDNSVYVRVSRIERWLICNRVPSPSSPQVVLGAPEELLPHSLCGVHGHGDPPGSLSPGVQEAKHHVVLWGGHGGCGQLHAWAVVHAEHRPEEEAEDFGEAVCG